MIIVASCRIHTNYLITLLYLSKFVIYKKINTFWNLQLYQTSMSFRASTERATWRHKACERKTNYVSCGTYKSPFLFNFTVMESQMWVSSQLAQCEVYFHVGQALGPQQRLPVNVMGILSPKWTPEISYKPLSRNPLTYSLLVNQFSISLFQNVSLLQIETILCWATAHFVWLLKGWK